MHGIRRPGPLDVDNDDGIYRVVLRGKGIWRVEKSTSTHFSIRRVLLYFDGDQTFTQMRVNSSAGQTRCHPQTLVLPLGHIIQEVSCERSRSTGLPVGIVLAGTFQGKKGGLAGNIWRAPSTPYVESYLMANFGGEISHRDNTTSLQKKGGFVLGLSSNTSNSPRKGYS
jgi:hypothetical protein